MTDDEPSFDEVLPNDPDASDSDASDSEPVADPLAWSGPNDGETDVAEDTAGEDTSGDVEGSEPHGDAVTDREAGSRDAEAARRDDEPARREDAPLSGLAASVEDPSDSTVGSADGDRFEEQDVTPVDADAVWERIEGDEPGPEFGAGARNSELEDDAVEAGEADPEGTGADEGREERDVDAGDYCKRCPYFSTPPEVRCTHPGTEILEVLDVDRFRVVDCPKVRETDRLERL